MLLPFIQRDCKTVHFWAVQLKIDFVLLIELCLQSLSLYQVSITNEKNIIIRLLSYNQFNNLETLLENICWDMNYLYTMEDASVCSCLQHCRTSLSTLNTGLELKKKRFYCMYSLCREPLCIDYIA